MWLKSYCSHCVYSKWDRKMVGSFTLYGKSGRNVCENERLSEVSVWMRIIHTYTKKNTSKRMKVLINCIYSFTELNPFDYSHELWLSFVQNSIGRWHYVTMWYINKHVSCKLTLSEHKHTGIILLIFHTEMIHALYFLTLNITWNNNEM